MANKPSLKTPKSEQSRTVYEVQTSQGSAKRVEASTTAELRDVLSRLLPELEPYAVQAVARLASMERATVTAGGWSVRRVGVMQFQPDELSPREPKTRERAPRKPVAEHVGQAVIQPAKVEEIPEFRVTSGRVRSVPEPHPDGRLLSAE